MTLLTDIRRSKSGALPWGTAQGDQDAIFWEAEDFVSSTLVEVAERLKKVKTEGADGI